jgi:hypothetical protein
MKNIMLCCIGVFLTTNLLAQSTDPTSPTTYSVRTCPGSSVNWANTGNILSSNDQYATVADLGSIGNYSNYLVATGFNFSIPAGYFIKGVKVDMEQSDPNMRTSDYSVRMIRGGLIRNEEMATKTDFPSSDAYTTYGGESDLWNEFLTPADVNNSLFGVAISIQKSDDSGPNASRIDHIRVTVYYTLGVLPVNLVAFTGTRDHNTVGLNWKTTGETNMDHYNVERSADGMNFTSIGSVPSHSGNSNNEYVYTDDKPFQPVSYYRLKMTGIDGNAQYSKVISLQWNTEPSLSIFPNPLYGNEALHITNPGKETLTIWFYNTGGKKVASVTTSNDIIDTKGLKDQKGTLIYRVSNEANQTLGTGQILLK